MKTPVIEILSAHKTYANGTQALAPVDLDFYAGEFISLIGPSGCGKSTLLKMVAGLIKPSDGRIKWWHSELATVNKAGKKLAFVFQEATLMPWTSVLANVRLPFDLQGMPRKTSNPLVLQALERVGLGSNAQQYPRELSGGMQMRVSIARALVTEPDLILMDEPFGALDEITRNYLDEEIRNLSREKNLTVIFVTHSVYEAAFLSDRVIVMASNPGRVYADYSVTGDASRNAAYRYSEEFAKDCAKLSELLHRASLGRQKMVGL